MKEFFKRITGIAKIEEAKAKAEAEHAEALARTAEAKVREEEAKKAEEQAKMTPKERATAKGEPWVSVLDTHVNKENIRNGFFELDWNDEFIVQLKQAGYGFDGDPDDFQCEQPAGHYLQQFVADRHDHAGERCGPRDDDYDPAATGGRRFRTRLTIWPMNADSRYVYAITMSVACGWVPSSNVARA